MLKATTVIAGIPLESLADRAQAASPSHKLLAKRLKDLSDDRADQLVNEVDREVFSKVNCLDCANCCKTTPALIRQGDIHRIAGHLGLSTAAFMERHIIMDEDGDFVINATPCPFLDLSDNACTIYAVRPEACREYPLTGLPRQKEILDITLKNASICPAVFSMLERMESSLKD